MKLTYKFHIKHNRRLDQMFRDANNLYNQALYVFNTRLNNDGVWTRYSEMDKIIKNIPNLEGTFNYRLLKAQVSQQVLRYLDNNIAGYLGCIKDWKKNPQKYSGMPRKPHYRKRGGMLGISLTTYACSIKNGKIRVEKGLFIDIPQWDKYKSLIQNFRQVRLIPYYDTIKVEIIYEVKQNQNTCNREKCAAIDLGVNNLVTMVTSGGCVIFSGKYLKSYNQYFCKRISTLQSIQVKTKGSMRTRQIERISRKRKFYFDNAFHTVSKQIVNILVKNEIGRLVVGYNAGWKKGTQMGIKNQEFSYMPYARLIGYLRYKCELRGIEFIECRESYTSKCDSLAFEEITRHEQYAGKRIKRGLYQSSVGKIINADHNGALNILRKVVGDSYVRKIVNSGHSLCPVRYSNPFIAVA